MSKCLDCPNPPPMHWKRCEACAMRHLRHVMSDGAVPLQADSGEKKIFGRGVPVIVVPNKNPEQRLEGKVVRRQNDQYVIDLNDGQRYYAHSSELRVPA